MSDFFLCTCHLNQTSSFNHSFLQCPIKLTSDNSNVGILKNLYHAVCKKRVSQESKDHLNKENGIWMPKLCVEFQFSFISYLNYIQNTL